MSKRYDLTNTLEQTVQIPNISNPAMRALEEATKALDISTPAMKALEEATKALDISTPAMKALEVATKAFNISTPAMRALEAINDSFNRKDLLWSNQIESINNSSKNLFYQLVNNDQITIKKSNLNQTFTLAILDEESDLEAKLENLEHNLLEHFRKNKLGKTSIDGFIGLFLSLFLFLCGQIQSQQFEDKYDQNQETLVERLTLIEDSQDRMFSTIMEHNTLVDEDSTCYTVERTVNLRARPSTKSEILTTLYPNQVLKLEKRKGPWIYLTYFDYLEEITRSGWVYKKYCKIIRK